MRTPPRRSGSACFWRLACACGPAPRLAGWPAIAPHPPPPVWQATFGELPAFLTLGGLLLQYALGMAVVARGFSRYLGRLCTDNDNPYLFVKTTSGGYQFDFMVSR